MKKKLSLIVPLALAAVAFYFYTMYNKEHTNVAKTDAMEMVTAEDLFSSFDRNEEAARAKYADQVLEVTGLLTQRDLSNGKSPQVVLRGNGVDGFIRCVFKSTDLDKVKALPDNAQVTIKGMCKGFNASEELDLLADRDVILNDCIIIE